MKRVMWAICIVFLLMAGGCGNPGEDGEMDSAMEYTQFTNQAVTAKEKETLVTFLSEAESYIRKPLRETKRTEDGVVVFESFKTKNQLYEYLQHVLSNELSDTVARKITDLSLSRDGNYLAAVTDVRWPSILDADPMSIEVIQHSTIQSVVEMDIVENGRTERLQYTIMKERDGSNPKIVQKTIQYN
ncbi:hypothetical protein [Alteribacter aurantiacus]|uniref:hypothetical protein n=1 Tax=Alteribacter aurantiacus TaxID=254410 RepID=UPI000419DBB8|nr:hypothetical protein [Alteribacter aurantiacus]